MSNPYDMNNTAVVSDGGAQPYQRIKSGQATALVIKGAQGRICRLVNPTNTAMTGKTLAFYDDPNGNTNNLVYTWAPGASDSINVQIPCGLGITVVPSAATTFDLLVEYT